MKLNLKAKMLIAFLIVGLIPMISTGLYSYWKSKSLLEKSSLAKLNSINDLKAKAVASYFNLIKLQALTLAHNEGVKSAFEGFNRGFTDYIAENRIMPADLIVSKERLKKYYTGDFSTEFSKQNQDKKIDAGVLFQEMAPEQYALQADYISDNPNALGSKHLLDSSKREGTYDKLHRVHHPNFREYLEKFEFYDIFLIDAKTGNIIYTVYKELDFATSLKTGHYKDSGLAKAFNKAMNLSDTESVVMEDYEVYRPSYDGPAGFIAAPIWINGEKKGVVAFQVSFDKVNSVTLQKTGEEKTIETYLVGSDFKMRSDAVADNANRNVRSSFRNPETGSLKLESIEKAIAGKSGSAIGKDYFGKDSLESYAPIEILGNRWVIHSLHRTSEALAPIQEILMTFLLVTLFSLVFIGASAIFSGHSLIASISEIVKNLRAGATSIQSVSKNSADVSTKLSESTIEQAASLQETVASLDEISSMVNRNSDSAENSANMSAQSTFLVQQGKEKAELMMGSITAIAKGNDEIINQIQTSNKEFTEIVKVIEEISTKTQVINDIVFQTKLLSFNASVEAARAGENGKGFAVVAEEVGNLASMSGKAASEITDMLASSVKRVTDIVDRSKNLMDELIKESKEKIDFGTATAIKCMSALDEISSNVSRVNEMVREISTASKEQTAGVREINKAMSEMDQATQNNSSLAQESSQSAQELQSMVMRMNSIVKDLTILIVGRELEL